MAWIVSYSKKAEKQYLKLPQVLQDRIDFLTAEIENMGPIRGNWKNYSKLTDGRHHCHLKKGKPTCVAVWSADKETVIVEVIYVGTHEKAPY